MSYRYAYIPKYWANKIYDILVKYTGAPNRPTERELFIACATESDGPGITEYRICHGLGFGGKFWNGPAVGGTGWYVQYYPEDRSPIRDKMMTTANARLNSLYNDFQNALETFNLQ
jgi:hypothetical protein